MSVFLEGVGADAHHIGGLTAVRDAFKSIEVYIHAHDAKLLTDPSSNLSQMTGFDIAAEPAEHIVNDGDVIEAAEMQFQVIHTPGHTPGSLCFRHSSHLISGDTVFPGGPGKTRTPDDFKQIVASITKKILILPDETEVYPGHGEPTILKKEKAAYAAFASRAHDPNLCGDVLWLTA